MQLSRTVEPTYPVAPAMITSIVIVTARYLGKEDESSSCSMNSLFQLMSHLGLVCLSGLKREDMYVHSHAE